MICSGRRAFLLLLSTQILFSRSMQLLSHTTTISRQGFLASASSHWLATAGTAVRNVDVGGGLDLKQSPQTTSDALFPKSMEGEWTCQRQIISIEGDKFMGEACFRALGGGSSSTAITAGSRETFPTKFVRSGDYAVLDRGFELASRNHAAKNVQWSIDDPNRLTYGNIQWTVVRRTVEPPTDEGFGFQEFIAIQDGGSLTQRAAQVKRRYRRNFDSQGRRVVEGLEIFKTYRVLDGIAGTEYPTAVIKSSILLTRPSDAAS